MENTVVEIKNIKQMLKDYKSKYQNYHPERVSDPIFPIRGYDIIHKTISYAIDSCEAIQLLVENNHLVNAAVITRTILETSIKLMWCRETQDGWQTLVADMARNTLDAANHEYQARGSSPISGHASTNLEVAARASDTKIPTMPSMLETLSSKQTNENAQQSIDETYSIFFKGVFHQLAHANLNYMSFHHSGDDKYRIIRGLKKSAIWIINASCNYIDMIPEDMKKFIDHYIEGFHLD